MINSVKCERFRIEFEKLKLDMERELGISVNIGTITFGQGELRCKITARERMVTVDERPSISLSVPELIGKKFKATKGGSRVMTVTGHAFGKPGYLSVRTLRGKGYIVPLKSLLSEAYVMIN